MPEAAVAAPQPVLQQELQVYVVVRRGTPGAAVVHRLAVVRVGAGIEQEPSQLDAMPVRRLVALTAAEDAGERGER